MRIKSIKEKKAALELSISTIVVIVIAMSMLVLGLVLVRTIFKGAKYNVDEINEGVMGEIVKLFDDQTGDLLVKLGSTNTAKVKPGDRFGVAIAARHPDGESVDRSTLKYTISLSDDASDNCIAKLGRRETEDLIKEQKDKELEFDTYQGSTSAAVIRLEVPKGTATCTQKVNIDAKVDGEAKDYAGDFFILEVGKEGIF